ncbi:MAG: site-2 protease family protein [Anaerolineae bacterium]
MRGSWRLGRLFGIDIGIDYSWLIIFGLVTWSLAAGYFPEQYERWPAWLYWFVGLLTSLAFFGSVLAHELSHSLIAKARGGEVRNITLFIFGGVASMVEEPDSPGSEFLMAFAGPLSSFVLAAVFGMLRLAFGGLNEPLAALLRYLAYANAAVGVFNLVPGFPLDGGRLLRAILWVATDSLKRATQWASYAGQGVAFLLIFVGIWWSLQGRLFDGLWLVFIGWFLNNAARASYRQLLIRDILGQVEAREVMTTDYGKVEPSISIQQLVDEHLLGSDRHAFLVVIDNQLRGLICLHDVRGVPRDEWGQTTVGQAMTALDQLATVAPGDGADQALSALGSRDVGQLPVVEGDTLVGLLRRSDLLRHLEFSTRIPERRR